ncbi:adenosylcobalamin/alpha-ribazole phosphatase [Kosakonia sp. LAM2021]|uniref:adenosylcobalamin/alpha-ribazole phosphatase n=1 Tax=Kosakonia sp. LAM2021 TaxID=2800475 RepID=UPI00190DE559|nr:adenosylcobalamin/alpha-ribazole phosphatase [Kosakonia sp. LAM2021]
MRLWLIRHGETEANVAGLYSGHSPTPLTPKGLAQAEALRDLLASVPFDYVLCSELERAQQTAARVLESRTLTVHTTPLLNEMFFGDWEMRHHRDLTREDPESYTAWCTDWQHAVPTNGEGFQAFSARIEQVIALLADIKSQHKNVLIASHQGVLSLLIARLLNMPAASLWHFRVDQGCWSAIDIHDDFATLRVLNSRAAWRADVA